MSANPFIPQLANSTSRSENPKEDWLYNLSDQQFESHLEKLSKRPRSTPAAVTPLTPNQQRAIASLGRQSTERFSGAAGEHRREFRAPPTATPAKPKVAYGKNSMIGKLLRGQ